MLFDCLFDIGYSKAARAVTGFAVYQWQTCGRLDLFSMHTMLEVVGYFIMLVALGYAVVRAYVFGINATYYHPLILCNRKDRPGMPEVAARHHGNRQCDQQSRQDGAAQNQSFLPFSHNPS
jgi:hypothetical protein